VDAVEFFDLRVLQGGPVFLLHIVGQIPDQFTQALFHHCVQLLLFCGEWLKSVLQFPCKRMSSSLRKSLSTCSSRVARLTDFFIVHARYIRDILPRMDFLFAVGKKTYEYILKMYVPLMDRMRDLQQFAATQIHC
jgi:hypothetical protein